MDDEPEKRGCRYWWDWVCAHEIEGWPLALFGLAVMFVAITIALRPVFKDYYISDTCLDPFLFGCLGLPIVLAILALPYVARPAVRFWGTFILLVLVGLFLLILVVLAILIVVAYYHGLFG